MWRRQRHQGEFPLRGAEARPEPHHYDKKSSAGQCEKKHRVARWYRPYKYIDINGLQEGIELSRGPTDETSSAADSKLEALSWRNGPQEAKKTLSQLGALPGGPAGGRQLAFRHGRSQRFDAAHSAAEGT